MPEGACPDGSALAILGLTARVWPLVAVGDRRVWPVCGPPGGSVS